MRTRVIIQSCTVHICVFNSTDVYYHLLLSLIGASQRFKIVYQDFYRAAWNADAV